jgi:hypothetical protein
MRIAQVFLSATPNSESEIEPTERERERERERSEMTIKAFSTKLNEAKTLTV